jgi:hypothetical protein
MPLKGATGHEICHIEPVLLNSIHDADITVMNTVADGILL